MTNGMVTRATRDGLIQGPGPFAFLASPKLSWLSVSINLTPEPMDKLPKYAIAKPRG